MAPPLYASDTREVPLGSLPTPLLEAIRAEAVRCSLSLDDVRAWKTRRENAPSTSFLGKLFSRRSNPVDPDAAHDMVLVLHATYLLLATHGEVRGTSVLSLPLVQATISRGPIGAHLPKLDAPKLDAPKLDAPADDGISISGFPGVVGRPGSAFFGLGGPASDGCFEALEAAVRIAKHPG